MQHSLEQALGVWASLGPMTFTIMLLTGLVVLGIRRHWRPMRLLKWVLPPALLQVVYGAWLDRLTLLEGIIQVVLMAAFATGLAYFLESRLSATSAENHTQAADSPEQVGCLGNRPSEDEVNRR